MTVSRVLRWVRPVAVTAILLSSPAVLSQTFFKGIEDRRRSRTERGRRQRYAATVRRIIGHRAAGGGGLDAYRRF